MVSYGQIETFLGQGLAPLFGNDPLIGGLFIFLAFACALAMWNLPLIISTIIMIGLALVLSLYANLLPINLGYLGITIAAYFFIMMIMKMLNER